MASAGRNRMTAGLPAVLFVLGMVLLLLPTGYTVVFPISSVGDTVLYAEDGTVFVADKRFNADRIDSEDWRVTTVALTNESGDVIFCDAISTNPIARAELDSFGQPCGYQFMIAANSIGDAGPSAFSGRAFDFYKAGSSKSWTFGDSTWPLGKGFFVQLKRFLEHARAGATCTLSVRPHFGALHPAHLLGVLLLGLGLAVLSLRRNVLAGFSSDPTPFAD